MMSSINIINHLNIWQKFVKLNCDTFLTSF